MICRKSDRELEYLAENKNRKYKSLILFAFPLINNLSCAVVMHRTALLLSLAHCWLHPGPPTCVTGQLTPLLRLVWRCSSCQLYSTGLWGSVRLCFFDITISPLISNPSPAVMQWQNCWCGDPANSYWQLTNQRNSPTQTYTLINSEHSWATPFKHGVKSNED